MTVQRRDANVLYVSFNARSPAGNCDDCPFRRCCSCAHWVKETRTCLFGGRPPLSAPMTEEDDWCGRWEPRAPRLVASEG